MVNRLSEYMNDALSRSKFRGLYGQFILYFNLIKHPMSSPSHYTSEYDLCVCECESVWVWEWVSDWMCVSVCMWVCEWLCVCWTHMIGVGIHSVTDCLPEPPPLHWWNFSFSYENHSFSVQLVFWMCSLPSNMIGQTTKTQPQNHRQKQHIIIT